jgi:spoIIIJ-associated protein
LHDIRFDLPRDFDTLSDMVAPAPKDVLEMILGHLGFVFEVREEETVLGHVLQVTTRDPGRLIGRDGHTLDELQYLVNRLAHPDGEPATLVTVDVEGYRESLVQGLLTRVQAAAERVRETGQPIQLEPLNSYDRRIVHNAFKDHPHIRTVSPDAPAKFKRMTLQPRRPA